MTRYYLLVVTLFVSYFSFSQTTYVCIENGIMDSWSDPYSTKVGVQEQLTLTDGFHINSAIDPDFHAFILQPKLEVVSYYTGSANDIELVVEWTLTIPEGIDMSYIGYMEVVSYAGEDVDLSNIESRWMLSTNNVIDGKITYSYTTGCFTDFFRARISYPGLVCTEVYSNVVFMDKSIEILIDDEPVYLTDNVETRLNWEWPFGVGEIDIEVSEEPNFSTLKYAIYNERRLYNEDGISDNIIMEYEKDYFVRTRSSNNCSLWGEVLSLKYSSTNARQLRGSTNLDGVFVFPNPSENYFDIGIEQEDFSNVKILVYDLNGQSVFSYVENDITGAFAKSFDHKLKNGVYVLKVWVDNQVLTKKLIVN